MMVSHVQPHSSLQVAGAPASPTRRFTFQHPLNRYPGHGTGIQCTILPPKYPGDLSCKQAKLSPSIQHKPCLPKSKSFNTIHRVSSLLKHTQRTYQDNNTLSPPEPIPTQPQPSWNIYTVVVLSEFELLNDLTRTFSSYMQATVYFSQMADEYCADDEVDVEDEDMSSAERTADFATDGKSFMIIPLKAMAVEVNGGTMMADTPPIDIDLDILQDELPDYAKVVSDLAAKVDEVHRQITSLAKRYSSVNGLPTNKGVSFLEVKYKTMLQYIHNLSYVVYLKLCGKSPENHPVVNSLIRLRLLLEKMKPVEHKLKYQIDKLVRAAVVAGTEGMEDATKSKAKSNALTSAATIANDPLAFRPNPANLVSKATEDDEEDGSVEAGDKAYRPPRLAPVSYDDDVKTKSKKERDQIRLLQKASKSRIMRDLIAEMDDRPEEIDALGGVNEGIGFGERRDRELQERDKFEEDNFVRLMLNKKDKRRLEGNGRMRFEDEFDNLNDFSNLVGMNDVAEDAGARMRNANERRKRRHDTGDDLDGEEPTSGKRNRITDDLDEMEGKGRNKFQQAKRNLKRRNKGRK
ncbi:hypothetical protein BZG36_01651 [Bifiguratus adelaidae]|uniref:Sas10 C-terminal domain-containing protein n=1 Tax=Bifiguratus adelaidae TaxID=1938954 RepID=A0A261Y4B0_9FUNG|nr:hypothetical protein BZG36_01651 [Bifiguratus adelaidae]